jgi:taurine dioxygenase
MKEAPITPALGSLIETEGSILDFSKAAVTHLVNLCAQRGVLVFPNQPMTLEEQAGFAHRLGEPLRFPNNPPSIPEELIKIRSGPKTKVAAGEGWHTDVSSEPCPPGLSMLRMEEVPESGGDTLFADMRQAFNLLSQPLQALLKTLSARHEPRGHYLFLSGAVAFEDLPVSDHPIVRIHPLTQEKALFVNDGFVARINGLSHRESQALLRLLYDHVAYTPAIQTRVRWQPNTVVFWDNRIVQHHAAFDYFPAERLGYRCTIMGEEPIGEAI